MLRPTRALLDAFVAPGERRFKFGELLTASQILSTCAESYCPAHYWATAHDIAALLKTGFIECARTVAPATHGAIERLARHAKHSARESMDHRELKAISALWLTSIGAEDVTFEDGGTTRRADVHSEQLAITVECGNTPPDAILSVLSEPGIMAIAGYPREPVEQPIYLFRATAPGLALGYYIRRERMESLRSKLEKIEALAQGRAQ